LFTIIDTWNRKKEVKKKKTNNKRWSFWKIFEIKCLYFLTKTNSIIFLKFFHKISNPYFPNFFDKCIGKREKNVKNTKKIKKLIVNDRILKMFWISNIFIFLNKNSRIFQNSLKKSIICIIKHYKNFHNFLTTLDRWNI